MIRGDRAWGLPLLAKELTEQAVRKRTAVLQTVYSALLGGLTVLVFYISVYRDALGPFDILREGGRMFDLLMQMQLVGVYLLLPAMMCGVITGEKERGTLGLLFLTRLRPWSVILEKYLSRELAIGLYLLMAVPSMTFCFALGGLSGWNVAQGVWILALTALQAGAASIACSAYFRTTSQAFLATYFAIAAIHFGPLLFALLFPVASTIVSDWAVNFLNLLWNMGRDFGGSLEALTGWPIAPENDGTLASRVVPGDARAMMLASLTPFVFLERTSGLLDLAVLSLPSLGATFLCLLAARVCLVRRAFLEPKNRLLKLFRTLDRTFQNLNHNRLTRGITLTRESVRLPLYEPVAWRETQRKSLGTVRYLVRVLLVLEGPTLFLCLLMIIAQTGAGQSSFLMMLRQTLWAVCLLFVAVRSAVLIAGERQQESLDVLLCTPMSTRDILLEKMRGVRRLLIVLAIPLLTCVAVNAWWRTETRFHAGYFAQVLDPGLMYLFVALASLAIQLPLVAWIGLHLSLRIRSQTRAILAATLFLTLWTAGGLIVEWLIHGSLIRMAGGGRPAPSASVVQLVMPLLCPPLVIFDAETGRLSERGPIVYWTLCIGLQWAFLKLYRRYVLRNASRWLGRANTPPELAALRSISRETWSTEVPTAAVSGAPGS
ncbi:MAG: ABC transporter permease [Planctomyces sp.]|nr:ABC transporter permease [Planctomyces sp.]